MPRWIAWLPLLAVGCTAKDADVLGQVGRRAGQKVTAGRLGGPVSEASLATKVHSRLRWDAPLAGADVQVRAAAGTVTLRGRVADEDARRRAVELARTTVGVEEVIDELSVAAGGGN